MAGIININAGTVIASLCYTWFMMEGHPDTTTLPKGMIPICAVQDPGNPDPAKAPIDVDLVEEIIKPPDKTAEPNGSLAEMLTGTMDRHKVSSPDDIDAMDKDELRSFRQSICGSLAKSMLALIRGKKGQPVIKNHASTCVITAIIQIQNDLSEAGVGELQHCRESVEDVPDTIKTRLEGLIENNDLAGIRDVLYARFL